MSPLRTVGTDELGRHLAALPGRPRVVVSGNVAVPWEVVRLLDAHCESYVLHALNAPAGIPDRPGVTAETCFVGPGMRRHSDLSYVPSRLSMVPVLYRGPLAPDVVVVHCAPPRDGMLSLGIEVNVLPAAVEACRARSGLVVAVVNEAMPYTGGDALLDVTAVDLAVEVTAPLPSLAPPAPDDDSRLIGERVASRVGDGARCRPASAASRTPRSRRWPSAGACGCGPRCSPTGSSRSTGPAPSTPTTPSSPRSCSAPTSSTPGPTATRGCA